MTEFQPTENDPLGRLLSELVDGDPTPATLEELATMLRDDPQARLDYVRWISLHADLLRRLRVKSIGDSEQQSSEEAALASFVSPEETTFRSPPRTARTFLLGFLRRRVQPGGILAGSALWAIGCLTLFGTLALLAAFVWFGHFAAQQKDRETAKTLPIPVEVASSLPGSGFKAIPQPALAQSSFAE